MNPTMAALANSRIQRCVEANYATGPRMRHCECCEVPVGTMTFHEFDEMRRCPVCKQMVHADERVIEDQWISFAQALDRFGVTHVKLRIAIKAGKLTLRENCVGRWMLESELMSMFGGG